MMAEWTGCNNAFFVQSQQCWALVAARRLAHMNFTHGNIHPSFVAASGAGPEQALKPPAVYLAGCTGIDQTHRDQTLRLKRAMVRELILRAGRNDRMCGSYRRIRQNLTNLIDPWVAQVKHEIENRKAEKYYAELGIWLWPFCHFVY
jgi:hypothetical protein